MEGVMSAGIGKSQIITGWNSLLITDPPRRIYRNSYAELWLEIANLIGIYTIFNHLGPDQLNNDLKQAKEINNVSVSNRVMPRNKLS